MAVNDITRFLDFQPQNQTDIAFPEPSARREPSEYRKALSRSVTPREDRRSTDSTANDRATGASQSRRNETSRSRDRSDTDQARESSATRASQPEQPPARSENVRENSEAESARQSNTETAREIEQNETARPAVSDTETANKPSVTSTEATGEIAPPSSLRSLFPSSEQDSQEGKQSHRLQTQDTGIQPPQSLALSLQVRDQRNGQNDVRTSEGTKSKSGPVPWNEALWNKPSDDGVSQGAEQINSEVDGGSEQPNQSQMTPNLGGEINAKSDNSGHIGTGEFVPETAATSSESTGEPGDAPNDPFAQESLDQSVVSQTGTPSQGEQRPKESAVTGVQAEVADGRQSPTNVEKTEKRHSTQASDGTQFNQSTGTIGVPTVTANPVTMNGQVQITPAVVAAASVTETAPEPVTAGNGNQPQAVSANSSGTDKVLDSGIKPVATTVQPVANGSAKAESTSASSERIGIAEQAADAARGAIEKNRPFRVRLNPPELGTLQVEITQRDGVYSARLEVQNSTAQQALLDHIEQLKETLQQNGIRLDRVDVQLNAATTDDRASDGSESRQQQQETSQDNRDENQRRRQGGDDRQSQQESSQDDQRERTESSDQVDVQI